MPSPDIERERALANGDEMKAGMIRPEWGPSPLTAALETIRLGEWMREAMLQSIIRSYGLPADTVGVIYDADEPIRVSSM